MSTRHGKRADGQATMTITISEETKARLVALAKTDERSLSKYVARELTKIVQRTADASEKKLDQVLAAAAEARSESKRAIKKA